ncbi:LOW QUALITY PROTEIN: uncharacterized protein [Alexandromys fortis]|uniref:LOW QUALITY PROTEIN: uncharacterized protein n=1 Tax=Alexandromys fortis TaxID=100897 RepID=UPI0021535B2D|nr:LOW QUALITY PROTEIN: uncharacterized protein LOC126509966 [Microtus fortis]
MWGTHICCPQVGGLSWSLVLLPTLGTLSPGNRRSYLLNNSSNSTQQESLAAPMGLEDSAPGVQQRNQQPGFALQRLEGEEIAPTDVKYRLQLLAEVPLQRKSSSGHSQRYKPKWNPLSKSHREWLKPWKMEDMPHHRGEPSHTSRSKKIRSSRPSSAPYVILPGHIQGRRTAPRGYQSHKGYVSQDQNNTQVPMWSQVLSLGLDKSGQGNVQSAQRVSREMAPGWPTTHAHQELSQTKPGIASIGTKSTAKFDEATTPRVSCLPPLKILSRRVKSKWPPHTPGIFQGKFQAELTGKHFFQDWRSQPQGRYGNNEKPLVPFEDQVYPRLTYMPLFTGRVKLINPRAMASNTRPTLSQLSRKKSIRSAPEFWPQKKNIWRKRLPE